jgi:hypothetical protein
MQEKFASPQHENTEPATLDSPSNGYWITQPDNGDLVVIGVANRQRKREDEIQFALDDAAQKVALFYGVSGKVSISETNGSGLWDYSMDIDYDFVYDSDYEKYLDALRYDTSRDAMSIDGAFLLRVRYTAPNPLRVHHHFSIKDGMPEWIKKPPDTINGFITGIGYARPQSKFKDTMTKAYKNAIASIMGRLSTNNASKIINMSNGSTVSTNVQTSEAELASVFVLETWLDPNTKGVWILAVAKPK